MCKSVDYQTIVKNDYSLVTSKYIEFIDRDLDIDFDKEMQGIQLNMQKLLKKEKENQEMLKEAFKGIGYEIE